MGSYRLNILFKNKNMTSSSGDFNIEYSSFSNVNSVSLCPTKAMYLENVACTITLRDIYGNLYGNNMSAAISHRLEIIGSPVLNGIVEYLSPGQYTVRYKPPTTGLAAISTKFNQNTFVSDQTSYINIEAGYGSKTSMGCPSVVVLNSTFLCKLNVSDLNGNPTNAGTISSSNFQSSCGSCWAFGSVSSFESRACISTGKDVKYSPEDTAFCSNAGFGCQ